MADRMKDPLVSSQMISSWITSSIRTCYDLAKVPAPALMAQVTSIAFVAQVPVQDFCRAATWFSIHTFAVHYAITQPVREDEAVGRAVMQSVLH